MGIFEGDAGFFQRLLSGLRAWAATQWRQVQMCQFIFPVTVGQLALWLSSNRKGNTLMILLLSAHQLLWITIFHLKVQIHLLNANLGS